MIFKSFKKSKARKIWIDMHMYSVGNVGFSTYKIRKVFKKINKKVQTLLKQNHSKYA